MDAKPRCKATTTKGEACKGHPLHGTELCLAHSDAEIRESVGFIPDNGKGGRKPLPTPTELSRKLLEDNLIASERPYWRALGFDVVIGENGPELVELPEGGAKLYGTQQKTGEINVSKYDDLGAQMNASEKLKDRVYGKPRQSVEMTGEDGGPIVTAVITDPELAEQARDVLRRAASTS